MDVQQVLEDTNNGTRTYELGDVYDNLNNGNGSSHEEFLELIENSTIDESNDRIVVDRDYALDVIYGPDNKTDKAKNLLGKSREVFEEVMERSGRYDAGYDLGDRSINEKIDRYAPDVAWERIKEESNNARTSVKANEVAITASLAGVGGGVAADSNLAAGLATALFGYTFYNQPKKQGSRDRKNKEAVDGWNQGYSDFSIQIS